MLYKLGETADQQQKVISHTELGIVLLCTKSCVSVVAVCIILSHHIQKELDHH